MQLRGALAEGDLHVAVATSATNGRSVACGGNGTAGNTGSNVGATSATAATELCEAGATLVASGGGAEEFLVALLVKRRTP